MKRIITQLLNLPGVAVEESKEIEDTIIFKVQLLEKKARCPRCSQISYRLHQNKYHLAEDLAIGGKKVILQVNRRQFKCVYCQKPFSEKLEFIGERKNFTIRYAEVITEQVINSNVINVAKTNKLTEQQVWSMVKFMSERIKPINLQNLRKLGINKISRVKSEGNFIVILMDLDNNKLIGLVPARRQTEVKKAMLLWGEDVLKSIEEVRIGMTGNYKSLIEKICPNAKITLDIFNVMKIVNEELNQERVN